METVLTQRNSLLLTACLTIAVATKAEAEPERPVTTYPLNETNGLYVGYKPLPSSELCPADQSLAVRVSAEFPNANFRFQDLKTQPQEAERTCYVTESRGLQIHTHEVECSPTAISSDEEPLPSLDAQLDLSVTIDACLRLTGAQPVQGLWSATLHQPGSKIAQNGQFDAHTETTEINEISVSFLTGHGSFGHRPVGFDENDKHPQLEMATPVVIGLNCLMFPLEARDNSVFEIAVSLTLIAIEDPFELCGNESCEAASSFWNAEGSMKTCSTSN